ncbi:MAG: hypothetical protein WCD18_00845 [Thermosynechococcaceae cyanobacterium]
MQAASAAAVQAAVGQKDMRVAAIGLDDASASAPEHRVLCSRRPLQVSADGTQLMASSPALNGFDKLVKLFCRDVRINTIVVRDYCAVLRE